MTSPPVGPGPSDPSNPSDLSDFSDLASPLAARPEATVKITPSGWWYAIGIVVAVLGVSGGVVLAVTAVSGTYGTVDDFPRVSVPGREVVTLEAGTRILFAEYPYGGYWFDGTQPYVTISDVDTGDELEWYPTLTSTTYDMGDHHGVSMGTVDVPADGRYEVVVREGVSDANSVAIGEEIVFGALAGVFSGLAVAALGIVVGVVALIVVGVKRGRTRRILRPATPVGGWSSGGPGGWAPPRAGWGPSGSQPGWAPPPPSGSQPGWAPPGGADSRPGWPPPVGPAAQTGWPAPGESAPPVASEGTGPDAPPVTGHADPEDPGWAAPRSGDGPGDPHR